MLTLASFYDEHDHHALRSLSLPLPYVLEEIQKTLEAQLDYAEPVSYTHLTLPTILLV